MREEYEEKPPQSNYRGFRGNYVHRPYYQRRPFKTRPFSRFTGFPRYYNNTKYPKPSYHHRERSRSRSKSRERSRSRSSSPTGDIADRNRKMRSRRSYSRHSDRSESSCDDRRARGPSYERRSARDRSPDQLRKSAASPDSVVSSTKGSMSPRSRHSISETRNSRHSRSRSRERIHSRTTSHDFSYKSQSKDFDIGASPSTSRTQRSESGSRNTGEHSESSHRHPPTPTRTAEQTSRTQGKLAQDLVLTPFNTSTMTLGGQPLSLGQMGPMILFNPTHSSNTPGNGACNILQKLDMASVLPASPSKADMYMSAQTSKEKDPNNIALPNGDNLDKGKRKPESTPSSPSISGKLNGLAPDKITLIREKKEEIEQAYKQDCETFATVVKMLISKDPSLEDAIQPSLRQNLRDIGTRCIQELQDYIDQTRKDSPSKGKN